MKLSYYHSVMGGFAATSRFLKNAGHMISCFSTKKNFVEIDEIACETKFTINLFLKKAVFYLSIPLAEP